jgi:hypothetical protein
MGTPDNADDFMKTIDADGWRPWEWRGLDTPVILLAVNDEYYTIFLVVKLTRKIFYLGTTFEMKLKRYVESS